MALEIQGKLIQINPEQTGTGRTGNNWVKQDIIIETGDQYPKKVCITCWGDKAEMVKNLQPGTDLKVAIDIESREFNGKWYTNLKAWKIETGTNATAATSGYNTTNNYQPPVNTSATQAIPEQPVNDDLPF